MPEPRFAYSPILGRRRLEMPGGERIAVWVGINVEYSDFNSPTIGPGPAIGDQNLLPNPRDYGFFAYGLRVGVFRIMEILDRYGIAASVLLNSDICEHYQTIIEEGNKRHWAWLGHGKRNGVSLYGMDTDEERAYLTEMGHVIEQGTNKKVHGWLGPGLAETYATPDLLAELGLTYVCDWCADDQPFELSVKTGNMINIPYSVDGLNDIRLRDKGFTGEDYYRLIIDQFNMLYRDGESNPRIMGIAVHPYITGQPFRAWNFDAALKYISEQRDVWLTTSDEIAAWYYGKYYREQT